MRDRNYVIQISAICVVYNVQLKSYLHLLSLELFSVKTSITYILF